MTTADTHEETETSAATENTPESTTALANSAIDRTANGMTEHDHGHTHQHAAPAMNPELTRTVEVEAPAEDVDGAFRKVVKRYSKLARIPGFRSGKVPDTLIRSRFAKDIRQEVLESLVAERFRTALQKDSLNPVSQPQISELQLNEGQPLRFRATFEILPSIEIDGYDSLTVQKPDATVTDEEYQAELSALLDQHATVEAVEEQRALTDGDWAEISFQGRMHPDTKAEGTEAEEPTEQGEQPEQPEIKGDDILLEVGGKNTLPAFSDALRGTTVGQEMAFEVEYPAEFGDARLAGKTVSYDVKVTALKRKTMPERNDEFAKGMGAYDTWQEFEDKLRERIAERKKETLETEARDKMLDELIGKFQFPVPETFVQQQIDVRLDRGLRALAQQGMTQEQMRQLDFARLREAQRDQALAEVKASLILDRIADRENITVSDDDMERELLMASLQAREPLETLRKRLNDDGSLQRIREQMRREKTGAALYEKLAA